MSEPPVFYEKYRVEHADGSPTDPMAEYVVLRVDKDPTCAVAAYAWADALADEGRTDLARTLRAHLEEVTYPVNRAVLRIVRGGYHWHDVVVNGRRLHGARKLLFWSGLATAALVLATSAIIGGGELVRLAMEVRF